MEQSLIKLIEEARKYLVGQMISDEYSGTRSSMDSDRADLVVRMEEVIRSWREESVNSFRIPCDGPTEFGYATYSITIDTNPDYKTLPEGYFSPPLSFPSTLIYYIKAGDKVTLWSKGD